MEPGPVAVLALQGDFEAHRKALAEIGVESFELRRHGDLAQAGGLIIPGGESSTLWKFSAKSSHRHCLPTQTWSHS